jgi:HK97 family phage portal protein
MNQIAKLLYKAGDLFNFKKKWAEYSDIQGGFDVFRNFTWDSTFSRGRQLNAYRKSVYVFACVAKIAQKTASIDWELFRLKNQIGDKQQVFIHDALNLLYRPNPFQTKGEFFEKYMINKKLTGEAFILKVRKNGPGSKVVELWNLRPDMMRIIKDPTLFIKAFEFSKSDGIVSFAPEDIIYDAYPNPTDDYAGLSPLSPSEVRVETEISAVTYQKNFFKNNARPDFILKSTNKIDANQKEEIKEAWDKRHKGAANSGKGAFLEGGLDYQQVSISQREMDYIESLKMTRDDILTAFGVPKPIVAITDDVNLANAKTAMEIFLSETIVPEIKRLTEKLNEHLIYPEFGDNFYIDFENPIPSNDKEIAEVQQLQIQAGTLLINEAREQLGLPPIVGGWSLYMPLANIAVGGLPQNNSKKLLDRELKEKGNMLRGRGKAIEFLKVREQVAAEIYGGIERNVQKRLVKAIKSKGTKNIIPKEIRGQYYDMVNKSIDQKGEAFKPRINDYADEQKARVLKALNEQHKGLTVKAVQGLFDTTQENKILSELSFPYIQDFLVSAGTDSLAKINPAETFSVTDRVRKFIKERAAAMAKQVNATTIDKLSNTLAEGIGNGEGINDLTDRVGAVYDEFSTYRSEMIARTEATAANNAGFVESYDQSGVANAKEWIATNDSRTRDTHAAADGEVVGLDDIFSIGLSYPGDPSGDPDETINCRCVLGPAFKE